MFGAIVAGVTPIVMGIFAIAVTLGIVGLFGMLWDFSFFTPNLISMMGLAVGIDYSLFIVSRYREERHRGRDKLDAIAASGATANRAVFFSGLTVVLALAGMLLVPTTIFRSLAGGAIIVVLVSVAASMTLLPAISRSSATGSTGRGCTQREPDRVLRDAIAAVVAELLAAGPADAGSRACCCVGAGSWHEAMRSGSDAAHARPEGSPSTEGGFWDRVTNRDGPPGRVAGRRRGAS